MKYLILTLSLVLSGFTFSQMKEVSDKQIKFVNTFVAAVESHDTKKIIKMMDKSYRNEQISFLGGNKQQFVDELFGGNDILSDEYFNMKIGDITRIEVAEVIALKDGDFNYIFRIRDGQHDIMSSLLLRTGKKFGFEGSRG